MAFGMPEWGIVLLVVLLLFGATAIPKLARALGRAKGEFNQARDELTKEVAAGEREASASEAQVRSTARGLGIDEQGRSLDEVKRLIQQKLA